MSGIKGITLTAAGTGYTSVPTVTIASGLVLNIKVRENKSSRNVQSFAGSNFANHIGTIRVAENATTVLLREGASTTDDAYNGSSMYVYEGTGAGQILLISDYVGSSKTLTTSTASPVLDATSKYYIGPTLTISGGGGSGATAAAIANEDGSIASIVVVNQGSGYTSTPSVSFAGQGRLLVEGGSFQTTSNPEVLVEISEGAGATAEAKLVGTGINEFSIVEPGGNFDNVPDVEIISVNGEGSGATATVTLSTKAISGMTVTNAGSGYTAVPLVRIVPKGTDLITGGSGTANEVDAPQITVTLAPTEVDSIKMTNFGGGYREPPAVTLSGGVGSGATARAVLKDNNINARIKGEAPLKSVKPPKANVITALTPFPSFSGGRRQAMKQNYSTGSLVMLKDGLYRVTGAEQIIYQLNLGLELEIVTASASQPTVKVVDGDFDVTSTNAISSVTIPAGTVLVFGDEGSAQETVKLKGDATFSATAPTTPIELVDAGTADTAITTATVISLSGTFGAGTTVTAMYIPGHRGNSSLVGVSSLKSFSDIEPGMESTMNGGEKNFYHLSVGIGSQPKFISAKGDFNGVGFSDVTTSFSSAVGSGGGSIVVEGQGNPTQTSAAYISQKQGSVTATMPGAGSITLSSRHHLHTTTGSDNRENHAVIVCPQGAAAARANELVAGNTILWQYSQTSLVTIPDNTYRTQDMRRVIDEVSTDHFTTSNGEEAVIVKWTVAYGATGAGSSGTISATITDPAANLSSIPYEYGISFRVQGSTAGDGGTTTMTNTSVAGVNYADGFKLTALGGAAADPTGDLPGETNYSVETTRGVVAAGTGQRSLVGFVSPRIRVFQPAGTPLWSIQEADLETDDFLKQASGWIDSSNSPAGAPNPMFSLYIGTGEEQSPRFQFLNIDENLRIPVVVLSGWKYKMREVPEDEVRNMIRRSGRFNYEIVPYAQSRFQKGQDPSGPVGGWHTHVKKHRGKKMSFEEYKASIGQTTDMTNNILAGSKSGMGKSRRDPRASYRRY